MPRDFDQEYKQDLTFTIGGETFVASIVRPEVLGAWADETAGISGEMEAIGILDQRVKRFLNKNGDAERWDKLRAREEDPVSQAQINGLLQWLVEANTSRPTQSPSPSASGRGKTAASSTGA